MEWSGVKWSGVKWSEVEGWQTEISIGHCVWNTTKHVFPDKVEHTETWHCNVLLSPFAVIIPFAWCRSMFAVAWRMTNVKEVCRRLGDSQLCFSVESINCLSVMSLYMYAFRDKCELRIEWFDVTTFFFRFSIYLCLYIIIFDNVIFLYLFTYRVMFMYVFMPIIHTNVHI